MLISTDGPNEDVLNIKPPLVLSDSDCDFFLEALCDVLITVPEAAIDATMTVIEVTSRADGALTAPA